MLRSTSLPFSPGLFPPRTLGAQALLVHLPIHGLLCPSFSRDTSRRVFIRKPEALKKNLPKWVTKRKWLATCARDLNKLPKRNHCEFQIRRPVLKPRVLHGNSPLTPLSPSARKARPERKPVSQRRIATYPSSGHENDFFGGVSKQAFIMSASSVEKG